MHLSEQDTRIVHDILARHVPDREVWAFGSRVHGWHLKMFSDLDLVLLGGDLPLDRYLRLKRAFTESDLLIRVDVVVWDCLNPKFRDVIAKEYEVIQVPCPHRREL
ncbi:MAG: nucleotidyltransferase domain-containing protein [Fimbriiglobus sp.]